MSLVISMLVCVEMASLSLFTTPIWFKLPIGESLPCLLRRIILKEL